ncbi:hypothetical protein P9239_18990 [Caballeronia sp. LZ062]|uniref:hypothetical protein n=1 Tax=unclassified Caballeronia TaxID=2646786 RepID=UPI002865224F|nr:MULTISPECIES: hypothetical protein [unclassified Caballeronia]MDR5855776.1 hypothetical protein [Caballeronia sp. LZ050]MDR5872437.1 hypothetical protein [Caballeronia sp. LZ062]
MSALIFRTLFVQSTTQKLAGRFGFEPGLNLITGADNSIGKSTLVRLPLWTFGCEFPFDDDWKNFDVRTLLKFELNGRERYITRYRDQWRLRAEDGSWMSYQIGSDAFEKAFASLVGFGVLLPRRKEPWIHEVPSPEHYFAAFYVDQMRGWVQPWHSFDIWKYENWKAPVLTFHIGYRSSAFFELDGQIAKGKKAIADDADIIDRYSKAVDVLNLLAPEEELPTTDTELDSAITDIQGTMVAVKRREQRALAVLRAKQEELEITKVQLGIAKAAIDELERDYDYATEQLDGDVLICPLCATRHDNTLLERASLLQDRSDAEHQVVELTERQAKIESSITATLGRLENVRDDLSKLNRRFKRLDKEVTVKSILESMGTDSVRRRANMETIEAKRRQRENNQRLFTQRRELAELVDDDHDEEIRRYFRSEMRNLCEVLRIKPGFGLETTTPEDFRRLAASGGGADSSRLQLAYHLAIHRLIQHYKTETLAPLILDTPNQQDQGALNYTIVASELKRRATVQTQFMVCATRHDAMAALEQNSHVIELDENQLLSAEAYERYKQRFEGWFA